MPGTIGTEMPAASARSMKRRKVSVSKKYWGDRPGRPRVDLALQVVEVGLGGTCRGMRFRIGRHRDLEGRDPPQPLHQIRRIGIALRMRHVVRSPGRRVAAQGHDVPHPGIPVLPRHVVHLAAGGPDAGQVRRGRQRGLAHESRHGGVGARLGGAARAIGDGDEAGRQWLQPPDAGPELVLQRLRARRKELEGQGRSRQGGRGRQRAEAWPGQPAAQRVGARMDAGIMAWAGTGSAGTGGRDMVHAPPHSLSVPGWHRLLFGSTRFSAGHRRPDPPSCRDILSGPQFVLSPSRW